MFITVAYIGSDMSGVRHYYHYTTETLPDVTGNGNGGDLPVTGFTGIKTGIRSPIPVSFPSSDSCTTANSLSRTGGQNGRNSLQNGGGLRTASVSLGGLERHEEPRFCVCLQQMPEPTLSPDWFDMQPTRELNGGQVRALYLLPDLCLTSTMRVLAILNHF